MFGLRRVLAQKHHRRRADLGEIARGAVCGAPVRGGEAVMHPCSRHNHGAPPGGSEAQVHIRLVEVEAKRRVEPAEPGQHRAAKRAIGALGLHREARRRIGRKGLLAGGLQRHRLAQPVHRPRGPLQADPVAPDHVTAGRRHVRVVEGAHEVTQPARLRHRIVVDEGHDLARGGGQPFIAGRRDIGGVEAQELDLVGQTHLRHSLGTGTVRDDDDLEIPVTQLPDPGETQAQVPRPPAAHDDHRNTAQTIPNSARIVSIRGTSSGLLSSQNACPRASTSTQSTGRSRSRNRSCSSPSSRSSAPGAQRG